MKHELKELLLKDGVDLVGIAPVDRFAEALPGCKPADLMPRARAVISLAIRVPRGAVESANPRLVTNAWNMANAELNSVAFRATRFLEDRGFRTVIIPPFVPVEILEKHGLAGELSLKHAAAAAGIGVMGFSGLLLTPRFGPRQRLGAVVTDAPLEADPLLELDFCSACQDKYCVRACPVGALKGKQGLDKLRCMDQYQKYGGRALVRFMKKLIEATDQEERLKLLKFPSVLEFYELHQFIRVGGVACVECMRACPVGKEPATDVTGT